MNEIERKKIRWHMYGELYVTFSRDDLAGNVTELQFPVEKA